MPSLHRIFRDQDVKYLLSYEFMYSTKLHIYWKMIQKYLIANGRHPFRQIAAKSWMPPYV